MNKSSLSQCAIHRENSGLKTDYIPLRTVMVKNLTASGTLFFPMGTNVMKVGCTQGPKKCTQFNYTGTVYCNMRSFPFIFQQCCPKWRDLSDVKAEQRQNSGRWLCTAWSAHFYEHGFIYKFKRQVTNVC